MDRRALLVSSLFIIALFPVGAQASLGPYGTIAGSSTAGIAGSYGTTILAATAQIIYQDNGATATVLDSTEAIFLDLNGNTQADTGDVQLSTIGPGAAGSYVTTPLTTNMLATSGGTALKTLLHYHDTLPSYASGGPDGAFTPGETLFLDANQNGLLDAGDLILAGTSPGSRLTSATLDNVFHPGGTECVYAKGTAVGTAAVEAGMIRVSTGCPGFASGTVVAGPDGDVGSPLGTLSSVVISGGDANFAGGEFAWIGTGTVANAHYRLVTNGPLAVGTIADCQVSAVDHAAADADCGTTTTSLTAYVSRAAAASFPAIAFPSLGRVDLNGDAIFSSADRLYFNFDGDTSVGPGDVRATSVGFSYGSRPSLADSDTQAFLFAPAVQPIVICLDGATGTVGTVDSGEVIALSLNGDDHFDFGDVPITAGTGCTVGTPRQGTTTCGNAGTWKAVTTAVPAGALMYSDLLAPGGAATRGDGLYVHFGAGTAAATNDVRISESIVNGVSYSGGSRVPASGSDLGLTLTALTGGVLGTEFTVRLFDADGSGGESRYDLPYLELGGGNLQAGPTDARLHNQNGLAYGKYLSEAVATNKDAVLALTDLAATAPIADFALIDVDGSGGASISDPVIMRIPEAACGTADANDVRASAGLNSKAAGTVLAADTEAGRTCIDLGSAVFAFAPTSAPYSSSSSIIVDIAGSSVVSIGDVRISGGSAGQKIQSGDNLLNSAVTPIPFGANFGARTAAAMMSFIDINGNGLFDGQEALVFDVDGNNLFSSGDVILTGTGGSTTLPSTSVGGGGGGGGGAAQPPAQTTTSTSTSTVTATQTVDPVVTEDGGTVTVTATGSSEDEGVAGTSTSGDGSEAVPGVSLLAVLGVLLFAIRRRL